ncbi:ROK family protein, partial [bacterium]
LKAQDWEFRRDTLKAIPSFIQVFIQANPAAFTETNFAMVLEMLRNRGSSDGRLSALEVIPSFIQANNSFATETNFGIVLEMLNDRKRTVCQYALEAIPSFIQANNTLATEDNFWLVPERLKKEGFETYEALTLILPAFIHANNAFATEAYFEMVLEMFDGQGPFERYGALEIIPAFIHANNAFATETNLGLVLGMLKELNLFVRQAALKSIPFFIQANPTAFTETNLVFILEMLKTQDLDARAAALTTIPFFIQANNGLANSERYGFILKMLVTHGEELIRDLTESMAFIIVHHKFVRDNPLIKNIILRNNPLDILNERLNPKKRFGLKAGLLKEYRQREAFFSLIRYSAFSSEMYHSRIGEYQRRGFYNWDSFFPQHYFEHIPNGNELRSLPRSMLYQWAYRRHYTLMGARGFSLSVEEEWFGKMQDFNISVSRFGMYGKTLEDGPRNTREEALRRKIGSDIEIVLADDRESERDEFLRAIKPDIYFRTIKKAYLKTPSIKTALYIDMFWERQPTKRLNGAGTTYRFIGISTDLTRLFYWLDGEIISLCLDLRRSEKWLKQYIQEWRLRKSVVPVPAEELFIIRRWQDSYARLIDTHISNNPGLVIATIAFDAAPLLNVGGHRSTMQILVSLILEGNGEPEVKSFSSPVEGGDAERLKDLGVSSSPLENQELEGHHAPEADKKGKKTIGLSPIKNESELSQPKVLFSILSSSDEMLVREVAEAKISGIDAIHVDYLDGRFTPGSEPFDCTGQIKKISSMGVPLEVHLMSLEPDLSLIERIIAAGLRPGRDKVAIHYESFENKGVLKTLIARIKETGLDVALVINPETPLSILDGFLDILGQGLNAIILMAIVPGAGSRPFIPATLGKISQLRKMLHDRDIRDVEIETDGGVNEETLEEIINSGIDAFIMRTWLLKSGKSLEEGMGIIRAISKRAKIERDMLEEMFSEYGFSLGQHIVDIIVGFCNGSDIFPRDEIVGYLRAIPGVTEVMINKDRLVDIYYNNTLIRFHNKRVVPLEHLGLKDRTYYGGMAVKVYVGNFAFSVKGEYILGISGSSHDSTVTLLKNGRIVGVLEEERMSRTKHDASCFPVNAIHRLLRNEGISLGDISHIAIGWNYNIYVDTKHSKSPSDEFFRKMDEEYAKKKGISVDSIIRRNVPEKNKARFSIARIEAFLRELSDYYRTEYTPRVAFVRHHLAHAASAYYPSGFEGPVLTIALDGYGDTESGSIWIGNDGRLEEIAHFELPNSLGWVWAAITEYLGFRPTFAEGEVMGFAPYGEPRDDIESARVAELRKIFQNYIYFDSQKGELVANPEYLYYGQIAKGKIRVTSSFLERLEPFVSPSKKSSKEIDPLLAEDRPFANLAFVLQEVTDKIVTDIFRYFLQNDPRTRELKKVAFGGGIALNILANGKIISDGLVKGENMFVQPVAGDAGTAIGAALVVAKEVYGRDVNFEMTHAFYGPGYSDEDIKRALDSFGFVSGVDYEEVDDDRLVEEAAQRIREKEPIAWFQGRSEAGPRALGARSILLNLLDDTANNTANIVKGRQAWRPSACSITEEAAKDYFAGIWKSPFMIVAYDVLLSKKHLMASGIHQYGKRLARPQTVDSGSHILYRRLLTRIGELTGVPAVVNTSFNKQEPLVENPEEAINTFRYMERVNRLFIGHYILKKSDRVIPPSVISLQDETQLRAFLQQAISTGCINDWDRLFDEVVRIYPGIHKIIIRLDCGIYGVKEISVPMAKELFEGALQSILMRYVSSLIYNYAIGFAANRIYIGSTNEKMSEVVFYYLRDYLRDNFRRLDYFANFGKEVEIMHLVEKPASLTNEHSIRHLLKPLAKDETKGIYIGVDVGATTVKCAVLKDGEVVKQSVVDTVVTGGKELKELIMGLVKEMAKGFQLSGIGISLPGVVNPIEGKILWLVNYEYKWARARAQPEPEFQGDYDSLGSMVEELRRDYKTDKVRVLNDVTAFAVASLNFDNLNDGVLLALGTGVGCARFENGSIDMGRIEQSGGFVVNIKEDAPFDQGCSMRGSFAAFAGVSGVISLSQKLGLPNIVGRDNLSVYEISQLLKIDEGIGYAEARRLYYELSRHIVSWMKLVGRMRRDKNFILTGGITVAEAGEELLKGTVGILRQEFNDPSVSIVLSSIDRQYGGAVGAAFYAIKEPSVIAAGSSSPVNQMRDASGALRFYLLDGWEYLKQPYPYPEEIAAAAEYFERVVNDRSMRMIPPGEVPPERVRRVKENAQRAVSKLAAKEGSVYSPLKDKVEKWHSFSPGSTGAYYLPWLVGYVRLVLAGASSRAPPEENTLQSPSFVRAQWSSSPLLYQFFGVKDKLLREAIRRELSKELSARDDITALRVYYDDHKPSFRPSSDAEVLDWLSRYYPRDTSLKDKKPGQLWAIYNRSLKQTSFRVYFNREIDTPAYKITTIEEKIRIRVELENMQAQLVLAGFSSSPEVVKKSNFAINGAGGRIGALLKVSLLLLNEPNVRVVGLNGISIEGMQDFIAKLKSPDTTYGRVYNIIRSIEIIEISQEERYARIMINGQEILVLDDRKGPVRWNLLSNEYRENLVVAEVSGKNLSAKEARAAHLNSGAEAVVFGAPPKDKNTPVVVMAANEEALELNAAVISCASCTTNAIAPFAALLEREIGIILGGILTIHAHTSDQPPIDTPGRPDDPGRSWAGHLMQTLAKTGAAIMLDILMKLGVGIHDGKAIRIPAPTGSVVIYYGLLRRQTTKEELKELFEGLSNQRPDAIGAGYNLSSRDILRSNQSAMVDLSTIRAYSNIVMFSVWYDNEWGYTQRLKDVLLAVSARIARRDNKAIASAGQADAAEEGQASKDEKQPAKKEEKVPASSDNLEDVSSRGPLPVPAIALKTPPQGQQPRPLYITGIKAGDWSRLAQLAIRSLLYDRRFELRAIAGKGIDSDKFLGVFANAIIHSTDLGALGGIEITPHREQDGSLWLLFKVGDSGRKVAVYAQLPEGRENNSEVLDVSKVRFSYQEILDNLVNKLRPALNPKQVLAGISKPSAGKAGLLDSGVDIS